MSHATERLVFMKHLVQTILPVENCLLVIHPTYRHLILLIFIISYYRCFPHGAVVLQGAKFCSALHSQPKNDFVLAIYPANNLLTYFKKKFS